MTLPNFDYLNQNDSLPDFSYLNEREGEPGVFSYLGNLATNFGLAIAAQGYNTNDPIISPMADLMFRNNAAERQQIQMMREQLKKANLQGSESWKKVMEDFSPKNFFSKIGDVAGGLIEGNLGDIVSQLPMMLASMAGAPLDAATGLALGQEGAPVLTPEERASKIKETAGIIVSTALGVGARYAMIKKMESNAFGGVSARVQGTVLEQETQMGLNLLQKGKPGLLAKQLMRSAAIGTGEAGIAGVSFGAVMGANEENQLGQMAMGLMFAPLGIAFELIGNKVRGGDNITKIQQKAGEVFALRQLGYSPDKSLFELAKSLENIATADDLAMAVAKGQLDAGNGHIIIQGVSKTKAELLVDAKENLGVIQGPNGATLFFDRDAVELTPNDTGIFRQTGYLPNEVVTYKGKDYLFQGLGATKGGEHTAFSVRDPVTNKIQTVPVNELVRNTGFNLDNPTVLINSPLTLKGKLLAVNRGIRNPKHEANNWSSVSNSYGGAFDIINPYRAENEAALASVQTGKPIAFIGMRQSRGQQIIGNGKFYALSPDHLVNYTQAKWTGASADNVKASKEWSKTHTQKAELGRLETAPGRQTIPGILDSNLSVNRVVFQNPFVFEGKHYSFARDVERFYNKYIGGDAVPNWVKSKGLKDSGATSELGKQWGTIFTPEEMRGIIEARRIEKKPIGIPTSKYIANVKMMPHEAEFTFGLGPGKTHSESHYAVIDRIVARAMKRNGHDGFIYRSGGIHNSEVVDILERGVWNRADQTVPVEGKASNILTAERFVDKLYDEFINTQETYASSQGAQSVSKLEKGFDVAFGEFTKTKGILPEEMPALRRSFEQRINKEIVDNLPDVEKSLFTRVQNEIAETQNRLIENGSHNLRRSAIQNNMYFDQVDAGVIKLRDIDSNKELGTFHSVQDAQEFISKSGQASGVNLDGNATIPPSASGAGQFLPDNIGPQQLPPTGWIEKQYALLSTRASWLTPNASLFKAFDTTWGTKLHENFHRIVDDAARLGSGKKEVHIKKLEGIQNSLGKVSVAEAEHVFNWMESRSIAEHEKFGGPGGRPLSAMEVALGKQIMSADLTNMYKYKNAMRSVDIDSPAKPEQGILSGAEQDAALRQQFNIGINEDNALGLLAAAERMSTQQASIGSAVHYARLLQNPELSLSRGEYAKKFKLSQKQLQAGEALDRYFSELAEVAGIPKDKLLFNYITHSRLYENGNLDAALSKFALDKPVQEFYAALNRTGELDNFERHPVKAALNYTNALYKTMYLNPAIERATQNLKVELAKVHPSARDKIERDAMKYLRDVRNIPHEGDRYADAAVSHVRNKMLNGKLTEHSSRAWANAINETFTVAAQGARIWAGIRDFYSNNSKVFTKWGLEYSVDVLELGAKADLPNLRQSGMIEGFGYFGFNAAVDDATSALSRAGSQIKPLIDKTATTAMKLSGQQIVNDMARAGGFLATRKRVAEMERKLINKDFGTDLTSLETYQKAYHSLQLERYSPAVQQTFDKLIKSNKFEEAQSYLGNQFIQETFGHYANANHPSGWNNNVGRLVGKFGQFAMNHRDYVVSLTSRGTKAQRLQALGRMAIVEGTVASAATLFGVNLSNLYSLNGLNFTGGPASDLSYTAYSALFGRGAEQSIAISRVKRLLPYDEGEFRGSIVVPFSFAFTDLVQGLEMSSNGDVIGGLGRIGGIRPQKENYHPSMFEQKIGDIVAGR